MTRLFSRLIACALFAAMAAPGAEPAKPAPPAAAPADSRAVMSADQVVEVLDETVDWYRMLGTQQQAATQPSDLLILYANRQAADQVMAIAFEVARANAELLSSEEGVARDRDETSLPQSLAKVHERLDAQRTALTAQIDTARATAGGSAAARADRQARIAVLQGQLDLVNARRNLLSNMTQFQQENDADGFGANALKAHIDAVAASVPAAGGAATTNEAASAAAKDAATPAAAPQADTYGIWDLASTVLRLRAKARMIGTVDARTADLQQLFERIRNPPVERLKELSARSDALAAQSASVDATAAGLRGVRDQYDTLAWLFQQTAAMVTPLGKVDVLLGQYRRNLANWSELTRRQFGDALRALAVRVGIFIGLIALVLLAAQVWRHIVFRYVHDARRRARFLLLRRIVIWCVIVAIALFMFATEIGSLATFAGLITAGLAVAMQSVLVSVVGYFFLVGKYGVRVGDRVQVGAVIGEVMDLGLVRLHLMELRGEGGHLMPTGRVVALANSVVFQASGGLFKQMPGIDLAWHEISLSLPVGADHAALKQRLVDTVGAVLKDYEADILRQTQAIQRTSVAHGPRDVQPQVQLHFSASGVEALVRYPVTLQDAAEIDERVSREVLAVIAAPGPAATQPA